MKSRTRRILLGVTLVSVLVLGALILALPTIASRGLEQKIESAFAGRQDMQARWSSLDVNFSGELELRDFHLEDAGRGVVFSVEVLHVKPRLMSVFEKSVEIEEVKVEGTELRIELKELVKKLLADGQEDASGKQGEEQAKGEDEKGSGALTKALAAIFATHPPRVVMERARVRTFLEEKPVAEFELTRGELSGGGGEPLHFASRGYMTTQYEKVPKLLRQRHSWDASLDYDLQARHVLLQLASGDEGEALLDLELPRIARGKIGRAILEVDLAREDAQGQPRKVRPTLQIEDVFVKVGGRKEEDIIALLKAETLVLQLTQEDRPSVAGRAATFEFAPSKFKELHSLRDRFKPLGGTLDRLKNKGAAVVREEPASKGRAFGETLEQLGAWLDRGRALSNAMGKLDVELDQSAIVMHVPTSNGLRAIRLVDDLDVSLEDGHLMMTGQSASGSFLTDVIFLPNQALPHSATMIASGVDLSKLPGMDQGRTLPNRGIRGRLGGVVDLSLHLLSPPTGVDLDTSDVLDEVTLRGVLNWHDGMLDVHGVADEPLTGLELDLQGALKWYPRRGEFELEGGEVRYNGLLASVEGVLRDWPIDPELIAVASMPRTPCQRIIDALPAAMLGGYEKVVIDGEVAPSIWMKWPLHDPEHLEMYLDGMTAEDPTVTTLRRRRRRGEEDMLASDKSYHCKIDKISSRREAWPEGVTFADAPGSPGQAKAKKRPPSWYNRKSMADVYWLNEPFIKRVTEGVSEEAEVDVGPGLETYVPLSTLPPYVGGAMYLSEEILFPDNKGVNFGLIRKAIRINLEKGRFVYGGSTVTQQLVKNLFLTRDKTLARKLQEALISLRMDEVVSKDRILELYLNCIEFGPDLYGIGPAARHYFGKEARELTPKEALFLAVIKPSPSYGEHVRKRGHLPRAESWFVKRFGTIFKRMIKYEIMTEQEVERANRQTLKWEGGVYAPEYEEVPVEDLMQELLEGMIEP